MHHRLVRVSTIAVLRHDDGHGPRTNPSIRVDSFADSEYWSTFALDLPSRKHAITSMTSRLLRAFSPRRKSETGWMRRG